jgi:hypothetical protein
VRELNRATMSVDVKNEWRQKRKRSAEGEEIHLDSMKNTSDSSK